MCAHVCVCECCRRDGLTADVVDDVGAMNIWCVAQRLLHICMSTESLFMRACRRQISATGTIKMNLCKLYMHGQTRFIV